MPQQQPATDWLIKVVSAVAKQVKENDLSTIRVTTRDYEIEAKR